MKQSLIVAAIAGLLVAGAFSQRTSIVARLLEAGLENRVGVIAGDRLFVVDAGADGAAGEPSNLW